MKQAIAVSFVCDLIVAKGGSLVLCYSMDSLPIFSSAVPPGSGAFQMPTRPSSASAASSTLRVNLRNASVTFFLFLA